MPDLDGALVPDMSALNDGGSETATVESPTTENQTTEAPNGAGSETTTDDGQKPVEGDPKPEGDDSAGRPDKQTRLNQRFGELTGKLKEKDEYIESLEAELRNKQRESQVQKPQPDENGNYTVEQLMELNKQQADAIADDKLANFERQVQGERIAARFDSEEAEVLKAYPMLDPNNAKLDPSDPNAYNEQLAQAIEQHLYDKLGPHLRAKNVKALSRISPKAIVDQYMAGARAFAQAEAARAAKDMQATRGRSSGLFDSDAAPTAPSGGKRDPVLAGFDSTA